MRISTRNWAAALTAAAVLGTIALGLRTLSDPAIAWLDACGPANWIVYPSPGDTSVNRLIELDASFGRAFHLDAPPSSAVLRFRAFNFGRIRINGRDAAVTDGPDWKRERTVEVAGLLRPGENRIEARVSNASGPPALWLVLDMPGVIIVSDEHWTSSWAGAATLPAALAAAPKQSMQDPDGRVMPSLIAVALEWQRLLLFWMLVVLTVCLAAHLKRLMPGWRVWAPSSQWPLWLVLSAVALSWGFLFVNNSPWLPLSEGFDAPPHLEYARFIQERRALPFADDGWQMFQPPLYYLLLAATSSAWGVSPTDGNAAALVRGLGLVIGLTHLALLGACLREVFPGRPGPQIAGVLIGGFLPCMLYLHQYPGNEPLVAMLSSAGILASLRLFKQDEPRMLGHALLGFLLGLALLAKFSALLLVPPILGALAVRALGGDRRWRSRRLLGTALSAVVLMTTCVWYFARVWQRFGTPFVGGWDARRGMGWWQDPGYRTIQDFLRFGRAFTAPLFAGFDGFWDGLYVTLWGDGLLSGATTVALVPPWWSPSLMSASLLLAAVPTAAVVAGAIAAFARWIRHPDATTGVLVWLAFLVFVSILFMVISVPAVAADKASYGLLGLVPLCAFGAHALDIAARTRRWLGPALASALGLWALTSYATYWIDASSQQARLLKAVVEMEDGDRSQGVVLVQEAHARDPEDWSARIVLARHLLQTGGSRSEIVGLLAPDEQVPGLAARHVMLAIVATQDRDTAGAEEALTHALAADPYNLHAHMQLAALRAVADDRQGAVQGLRQVLRIDPQHQIAHAALSRLYWDLGDPRAAAMHQAYASRLQVD